MKLEYVKLNNFNESEKVLYEFRTKKDMEYIKWLSLNDLALGSQLKRMDEIFKVAIERKDYTNINEIMELFIVCKYMTAQIYPSVWSQKDISEYKKIVKKFKGILGKYFNTFPKNKIKNMS